jgi:hypothetical protein
MTHLPYIVASYGLVLLLAGWFAASAWLRVGRARRKLASIDPRSRDRLPR